ncbi:MAG: SAM-dependent chlorinase/fluorinase, partial [Actinobacteria bacterium]|nr:SAM-dependent chlorinase/fluorinase [Actinomycetota bacterium]
DVFAPAAAHLARGVPLDELGPPVAVEELVRLTFPPPRVVDGAVHALVLEVDRFGNVALGARPSDLDEADVVAGTVELHAAGRRHRLVRARTFGDVADGELVLLEDSTGRLAVAVNGGDAARLTGIGPGDEVVVLRS